MMTFPIMQPPPAIEFADNEHIQQLYRDLQTLFQKDIMRRQSLMGHHGSPLSGTNGHLKRERTDEPPGDIANKRRDTGESKVPTPGPGTPSSRRSPSNPAALNSLMPPVTPPHGGPMQAHTNDLMSMGSPSMPPPNMSQGMMNVEQQAATAALAQRRMRAMQQDVNRSVPIASSSQGGMSGQGMAGPSGLQNAQGQMGAGMNQMSIQQMNILQDPTHPIVRFLSQQVPGFSSMPVLQQLHHFNRMQVRTPPISASRTAIDRLRSWRCKRATSKQARLHNITVTPCSSPRVRKTACPRKWACRMEARHEYPPRSNRPCLHKDHSPSLTKVVWIPALRMRWAVGISPLTRSGDSYYSFSNNSR